MLHILDPVLNMLPAKLWYMILITLTVCAVGVLYSGPRLHTLFGGFAAVAVPFIALGADLAFIPYSFWSGFGFGGIFLGLVGYGFISVTSTSVGNSRKGKGYGYSEMSS